MYVRDCSPVSPYALMLFGGRLASAGSKLTSVCSRTGQSLKAALHMKLVCLVRKGDVDQVKAGAGRITPDGEVLLSVDGWIKFRVPTRVEALILDAAPPAFKEALVLDDTPPALQKR